MILYFEINDKEYAVGFDYKITSRGCSAHMGSLSYPGHPAEPMEWEIDGELTLTAVDAPEVKLEIPEWLNKQLIDDIYEDPKGTIQDAIEQDADKDYYDDRD